MTARTGASADAIALGPRLATAARLEALHADGMALVAAAAAYLDGPGRQATAGIDAAGEAAYARQSLRLTSRLMEAAAWLLLQRAVLDGEMSADEAARERARIRPVGPAPAETGPEHDLMPEGFRELVRQAAQLHARIRRFESERDAGVPSASGAISQVERRLDHLASALGVRRDGG